MKDLNSIKVLLASSKYPPEYAGSGLRAHRTYKRLCEKFGISYKVICGSVAFNDIKKYVYDGAQVYRIACKLFKNAENEKQKEGLCLMRVLRIARKAVNYITEALFTWIFLARHAKSYDLIHIFGNNNVTSIVFSYAKFFKKPVLLEICNVSERFKLYEPPLISFFLKKGLPPRSKAICISKRIKMICKDRGYAQEDRIWCRPNPVDDTRFFPEDRARKKYRKKLNLFDEESVILINVGKICPLKNQIFLLEVMKKLPECFKLIIGGPVERSGPFMGRDAAYKESIGLKIEKYGLQDRVKTIWGFIDKIEEYMKASDIYLMPSKMEACATPVLEALACGLAVVAHNIEGVTSEWITEGVNGYLASLDVVSFSEKIKEATLLDKDRLEKSALEIAEKASIATIDNQYFSLIKELLNVRN